MFTVRIPDCGSLKVVGTFDTLREAVRWYAVNLIDHPAKVHVYEGRNWCATYHPN
jgi:uncharacterized FlgJ-related protein